MDIKRLIILLSLLIGLPLTGAFLAGSSPVSRLFSPSAILVTSRGSIPLQPFSLALTLILSLFAATILTLFLCVANRVKLDGKVQARFPYWGWCSLVSLSLFWFLSWSQYSNFWILKQLSFTFLWFSYIALVNALAYRKKGNCLLLNQPKHLLKLFVISIPFWWYFEYLNRFVLNWYYLVDEGYGSMEYYFFGSLAFGTVLPAVISTKDCLLSYSLFSQGFDNLSEIHCGNPRLLGAIGLLVSSSCLALLPVWPQYLFLFLWIAPLLMLVSLQTLWNNKHIFNPLARGDWSGLAASALAAVICGFVWELWNLYSLPKWIYSVPWVGHFKIFEMPLVGYLGYIPFGWECFAVAELVNNKKQL